MELEAALEGLQLLKLKPIDLDVEKFRAGVKAKELFQADMDGAFRGLGSEQLNTHGKISLNLKNLMPFLPPGLLPKTDLRGITEVAWALSGRLPGPDEMNRLTKGDSPLLKRLRQTGFLNELQVIVNLKECKVVMTMEQDASLKISRIRTPVPLSLALKNGLKQCTIKGKVAAGRVEELPSIGRLEKPVQITLSFSGTQQNLKTIKLSEELHVTPLKIDQSLRLSLDGIDRLLSKGFESPLSDLLKQIEGRIYGDVKTDLNADTGTLKQGLFLKGNMEAGADVYLAGGKEIRGRTWLESPGLDVRLSDTLKIGKLKSHLRLEKKLIISREEEGAAVKRPSSTHLSVKVLNPQAGRGPSTRTGESIVRRLRDDLRGRWSERPSLSFDSFNLNGGPVPIRISNHVMAFRLLEGLPSIEYFQMDLLGGTVIGSLSVSKKENTFVLDVKGSFSGLNARELLPGVIHGESGEQEELGGRLSLLLPISGESRRLFNDLEFRVDLTHIGSKALERFLYAVDPYESNETIIRQRELLRLGTPRWIKLKIRYGSLSLSGVVVVKSASVNLPRIERLNVADLPVHGQIQKMLSWLGPVVHLLKTMSAREIRLGENGSVRFVTDQGMME